MALTSELDKWMDKYLSPLCLAENSCQRTCCQDIYFYYLPDFLKKENFVKLAKGDQGTEDKDIWLLEGLCSKYDSKTKKCTEFDNPERKKGVCGKYPIRIDREKISLDSGCYLAKAIDKLKDKPVIKSLIKIAKKYNKGLKVGHKDLVEPTRRSEINTRFLSEMRKFDPDNWVVKLMSDWRRI